MFWLLLCNKAPQNLMASNNNNHFFSSWVCVWADLCREGWSLFRVLLSRVARLWARSSLSEMAHCYGWRVGTGCQREVQLGLRVRVFASSLCDLSFVTVWCLSSIGETPRERARWKLYWLLGPRLRSYFHCMPRSMPFKHRMEGRARFWNSTWDGKCCCSHLRKTPSARILCGAWVSDYKKQ